MRCLSFCWSQVYNVLSTYALYVLSNFLSLTLTIPELLSYSLCKAKFLIFDVDLPGHLFEALWCILINLIYLLVEISHRFHKTVDIQIRIASYM